MAEVQEQPKIVEVVEEPAVVEEVVEIQDGSDAEESEDEVPMTLEEKLAENRKRIDAAGVDAPKVQPVETKQSRQEKKSEKSNPKIGLENGARRYSSCHSKE